MMFRRFAWALLAVLPASALPAARPAAHARVDWSAVAQPTADGGIRVGNPRARVQLVEYGSFTCPHCAAFAGEAWPALRDRYLRTGQVSFEFRAALRDSADLTAATVAHCVAPAAFFATASDLYARQKDWEARAIAHDQQSPADPASPPAQALGALAQASGLADIGAAHGVAPPRLAACFADNSLRTALTNAANDAWNVRQIGATPTFFLNGDKLSEVYGWAALEPHLRAALKS